MRISIKKTLIGLLSVVFILTNSSLPEATATYLSKLYFTLFPHCLQWPLYDPGTDTAIGSGGMIIVNRIEDFSSMSGQVLQTVELYSYTAGTTGTISANIRNETKGTNLLSTSVSIDSGEKTSTTAATPYVISAANDDVVGGDVIYPFIESVHTTPAKGLTFKACFSPR